MYANLGTATVTALEFKPAGKNVRPAKNRGVFFDGTNGTEAWIQPSFMLNHTFAVHTWLRRLADGADHTVLNRVRSDFSDAKNSKFLRLYIDSTDVMGAALAKDSHNKDNESYTLNLESDASGTINIAGGWYYLVWSFELTNGGKDTTLTFFINNTARATTKTWTDTFVIDKTSYMNYIGIERTADTTWGNAFNGYIHDFAVY